jgi:hypothetical protein
MPLLERFVCPVGAAVGFVVPLFCRYPGANLFQIQLLDRFDRIKAFEDIVREPCQERRADQPVTAEIGDPAIWAFLDAAGGIHVGTKQELRRHAPALLSSELIERWPASAADLLRLCELEDTMLEQTRDIYAAMTKQIGVGASIWRDTDLLLPLIRQHFVARLNGRAKQLMLSDIWTQSVGETCHVFCPAPLLSLGEPDLSGIGKIASAWGITVFKLHPQRTDAPQTEKRIRTWPVAGLGGVGRWTIRNMWGATGSFNNPNITKRIKIIGSIALEGQLTIPSAGLPGSPAPPQVHIIIHGSAQQDVEAGQHLFGDKQHEVIRHVINIRPIGNNPERRQAVPAQVIAEDRNGPDYVWVIANHRSRQFGPHYAGLARSNAASRFARAGISALADLCYSSRGRTLLQGTFGARAIGIVGATRYRTEMGTHDLLLSVLYSMLSPEWTFTDNTRLVCLWPHPLPQGSFEYVRLGRYQYSIEMIGLEQSGARADIRCLAFNVREMPSGVQAYAKYITLVLAVWGWDLHENDGEAMLFEKQGSVISMLVAETPARLDAILRRDRNVSPKVDIVVTNRSLSKAQDRLAEAGDWPVIHHCDLPSWISARV